MEGAYNEAVKENECIEGTSCQQGRIYQRMA
jgi:hypothetical protein